MLKGNISIESVRKLILITSKLGLIPVEVDDSCLLIKSIFCCCCCCCNKSLLITFNNLFVLIDEEDEVEADDDDGDKQFAISSFDVNPFFVSVVIANAFVPTSNELELDNDDEHNEDD